MEVCIEIATGAARGASPLQCMGAHIACPLMMRFTIEQRHLTDTTGRPLPSGELDTVSFHCLEADSADAAIRLFITPAQGEIIGDILKFPGFQAVATVRTASGVYTLQVAPTSSQPL